MTDPTQDTPPTLVERLRNTASYLAAGCVLPTKPDDGSDDPPDPVDDVTFEVEELRDLASLYAAAADDLEEARLLREQANAEITRLTAELGAPADPPNRAYLLGQLEGWDRGLATLTTGELIRDATAAIRTDARVIESARATLKAWHSWARKIGRAEGDEYASAMPVTLQARIAGQVEAGQLALLVEPIRRRVELTLALCADMGLGGPEAAELAPKAALWTDAEVAEIEAFRTKDWSGTGLNPFDHLPPALERTIYPGPGGRRAYLKRAGEPLPPEAPASADRQLGLPGLPKPETAMRLRLALIDKPDGPLSALVAGFAQALLEKLDKAGIDRDNAHAWMEDGWADTLRRALREHVEKGDPRDVAAYSAFAWHHGWSLAPSDANRKREFFRALQDSETARDHHADLRYAMGHTTSKPSDLDALHAILTGLLNAEPPLDLEVFPVDPATGEHKLEGEGGLEMAARLLILARQRGAFDRRRAPSDPPSPPGYTPWISMGNTGWALAGVRVADDVIGAWAHYAGLWTSWARELAGCSDGTDEELRGYIARLVGRMHAQRGKNLAELDGPQ